jgi:hypothetical protein
MIHDLDIVSFCLRCKAGTSFVYGQRDPYSKPMCEWTTRRAQKMESATGLSDPAAKGARVKGMMPAEMILAWYVSLALIIAL